MKLFRTKYLLHIALLLTIISSASCKTLLQKGMPNGIDYNSLDIENTQVVKTFETAKKNDKNVLLIFDAAWCGSCRKLNQITMKDARVRKTLADYEVINVDVDKLPNVLQSFRSGSAKEINSVPTIMIFSPEGIQTDRLVGYYKAKLFNKILKRNL